MSRIFVTGDTHIPIDIHKLSSNNFPQGKELTKADYVIVLGDFGLIWNYKETGKSIASNPNDLCWANDELYWKKWLEDKPWTILFIDGNHEHHTRLNSYPVTEWNGGKVHQISDSIIHLMRGQVFTLNNQTFFTFGGAQSIDRGLFTGTANRDRGKIWWDEELASQEEMNEALENLNKHNFNVDYILTHCLPVEMIPRLGFNSYDRTSSFLGEVKYKTTYKEWYCGHYHIDKYIGERTTVMYQNVMEVTSMRDHT